MSNKKSKRKARETAKAKAKAKLKVLNVTSLAPDTHFVALQVKGVPEPTGNWVERLKSFMGW